MGVQEEVIKAELYKLLVYDPGAFFLRHRDTEKSPGMFGTLVIVLPSEHAGGELVVSHGEKEVTVSLANNEVSAIRFAAFYADCEHEVKPIVSGNRVCLIYNLIRRPRASSLDAREKKRARLEILKDDAASPDIDHEVTISKIAQELSQRLGTSTGGKPAKLVCILSHYYNPVDLAPSSLKSGDLIVTNALTKAAEQAGITVYLGILHIFASRYDEEWGVDSLRIDGFLALPSGRKENLGALKVLHGEIFPKGIINEEAPDEHRYAEDTGNEGSKSENAYHRVALVMWRNEAKARVVAQNGSLRVLGYIQELVDGRGRVDDANRDDIARAFSFFETKKKYLNVDEASSLVSIYVSIGDLVALRELAPRLLKIEDAESLFVKAIPHLDLEFVCDLVKKYAASYSNGSSLLEKCKEQLQAELVSVIFGVVGSRFAEVLKSWEKPPRIARIPDAWRSLRVIDDDALWSVFMNFYLSPHCDPRRRLVPLLHVTGFVDQRAIAVWKRVAETLLKDSENPPAAAMKNTGTYIKGWGYFRDFPKTRFLRDRKQMEFLLSWSEGFASPDVDSLIKRLKASIAQWPLKDE